MYAYCGNNPVLRIDPAGISWKTFWDDFTDFLKTARDDIKDIAKKSKKQRRYKFTIR